MITPLYGELQNLKKAGQTHWHGQVMLDAKTVKMIKPGVWGKWICTRSQFASSDIALMVSYDSGLPQQVDHLA